MSRTAFAFVLLLGAGWVRGFYDAGLFSGELILADLRTLLMGTS